MNLALMAGLLFIFGMPLQVKNPSACEHAAPPVGMRWVCANQNPCDCHLAPMASEEPPEGTVSKPSAPSAVSGLACRIAFFVIPAYPQAARQGRKECIVSASLVLGADGRVEAVRIQSGDPQLAHAVQSALQQWRFTPGPRPESIPVSIKFELSDSPTRLVAGTSLLNTVVTAPPLR
jgi:TonB family protein